MAPSRGAQARKTVRFNDGVFLNVPFDRQYERIFRALVFAVHDCGFQARCALEADNGGVVRIEKLYGIIEESRLGVHDISRTSLDAVNRLPRFNMPLELGIFLGARRYGNGDQRVKTCLILDKERYRYQKFCSDISGQDVRAHENSPMKAIRCVRNWLQLVPGHRGTRIPSAAQMAARFAAFHKELPKLCARQRKDLADLTFFDYQALITGWLKANRDW